MSDSGFMTTLEVVDRVLRGLRRSAASSYLIEVPPGFNAPDPIQEIQRALKRKPIPGVIVARIPVDAITDSDAFVDRLISSWTREDRTLAEHWRKARQDLDPEWERKSAIDQLNEFFSCAVADDRKLVALFQKFEKIYRVVSQEMLATLRDLEQYYPFYSINCSACNYGQLSDRRKRSEKGFTSDYGQWHTPLIVGPIERSDAIRRWTDAIGDPDTDKLAQACFGLAFTESGGMPELFELAIQIAKEHRGGDYRGYMQKLQHQLPDAPAIRRLLKYADLPDQTIVQGAIATVHLGTSSLQLPRSLMSHRWSERLVKQGEGDGRLRLVCGSLGRAAVAALRLQRTGAPTPIELYSQREYVACRELLRGGLQAPDLVARATEMMAEVYGDSPGPGYFEPSPDWHAVTHHAEQALPVCPDEKSALEFRSWLRIARTHEEMPPPDKGAIEKYLDALRPRGLAGLEAPLIHSGIRIVSVLEDPNIITAAYVAVPIPETLLRIYVSLVLDLPTTGEAYASISEEDVEPWWKRESGFRKPAPDSRRLEGTELAMLTAIVSAKRGDPIFADIRELDRLLSAIDSLRNLCGHYVTEPKRSEFEKLMKQVTVLYHQVCRSGGLDFTLQDLRAWMEPPSRFMDRLD